MTFVSGLANGLLIGSALCNALIGVLVAFRNFHARENRYFFLMSLAISGWATTNVLFQMVSGSPQYAMALLSYGFAAVLSTMFLLFCTTFTGIRVRKLRWLALIGIVMALLATAPGVVASGVQDGKIQTRAVPLILFAVVVVGLLGLGLSLLIRTLRKSRGIARTRLQMIFVGLSLGAAVGVFCNLLLPLQGTYSLVALGPSGSLFFVALTAYAIVKHRLFDIRFFVVRAAAYLLSLFVIASLIGLVVLGTSHLLFHVQLGFWTEAYISLATAFAALIFGRLKTVFDRTTSRLFYRDAYDAQTLLDDLNRILVANTDIERLLRQVSVLLENSLKAEFCFFGLRESLELPQRIIGPRPAFHIDPADIEQVRAITPGIHQKVILADELDTRHVVLRDLLQKYNIALLGRLTASVSQYGEGLGYLVLGQKQSGNSYTPKDIRTLETIVNELVIAIENALHFEEIQNFNLTLQERIDTATHKLTQTNKKLRDLDETKDEFITMASHQLRTPLTAVKGYLSMVLEGDAGKLNAQQKKLLQQSFASSQRMVYLIADLLNLSRLGTGKFVIDARPTNLVEVVQTELDQLAQTAQSREVVLSFTHSPDFPEIMLDETKTHQVVMNLIDNAIYYTPPGGKVAVTLEETPGSVVFTVKDTGIGVPRREQRHLFSKFYRAENARKARPDGTGLGLFMAKKVVAAQGGAIIFDSEEGKGSTFGFRFSKTAHTVPAAVPSIPVSS